MALPDKLFLDANVLFTAAHNPGGKAALLFELQSIAPAPWQLATSAYAIHEARRNLELKFPAALHAFAGLVTGLTIVAQPASPEQPLELPVKDIPIWSAALAARVTHLLTGDLRDFGAHMNRPQQTFGVIIQTVSQYLDQY